MAAIINLNIDLSKIDKSKIVEGKNGAKYYNITLSVNDESNEWGSNVSAYDPQTKEQRDAKEKRSYLGNGAVAWQDGRIVSARKKDKDQTGQPAEADLSGMDLDLPF